ncbi:MAG: fibronectin/fibrinogen-binding protein [Clostridiaceae bacterium]|jgi:predicted ribosome quality control (RQC) complex YloA/Tae2 family protein|nr:NFACT RNA binding domain-containing protein [Bacillota bacterium]NLN51440.1 fibronectin/fibrinogen-binding protein [Clostridiaceae bacterium]
MPLDGIGSKFLTKELNFELSNARTDRIYQPDRFTIIIFFRVERTIKKLLISANPSSPRIYLTTGELENPKTPPPFCMMLRKHLLGARLIEIIQPEYERVFIFKFSALNEIGDLEDKYLIAEIMGRYSNIILLNQDKKIYDSIIHVDQEISSKREIMPARPYQLPPKQDKETIDFYLKQKPEILSFLDTYQVPSRLDQAILNNVQGFSPLLSRSIVAASKLEARSHLDQLSTEAKQELSKKFYDVCEMIKAGADQPTLYFRSEHDQQPYDFHALELKALPYREKVSNLSLVMDVFYRLRDQERQFNQFHHRLERKLKQAINRAQKKLDFHQQDYNEGLKAEQYQKWGELLKTQLYLVENQAEEVELIDYYDPEQNPIRIKLKRGLSPSENVKDLFKKYDKAKAKYKSSKRFIVQDQAELEWLHSLNTALERAEVLDDLEAVKLEFDFYEKPEKNRKKSAQNKQPKQHILQNRLNPGKPGKRKKFQAQKKKQTKRKNKQEKSLPPRKFSLAEGITAYAGRNNLQNDQLTLRRAKPNDLWFHAKDLTGTHVILEIQDGYQVEQEHILTAAQIAAWYSEANQVQTKHGGQIAVDSCLAQHVKKPKGARPGMVIYDHYKTYNVKPQLPSRTDEN